MALSEKKQKKHADCLQQQFEMLSFSIDFYRHRQWNQKVCFEFDFVQTFFFIFGCQVHDFGLIMVGKLGNFGIVIFIKAFLIIFFVKF